MLEQPVRLGGLALTYALATSVLVVVTFLASNLVLSVIGGIGQVTAASRPESAQPAAAVLLSAPQDTRTDDRVCTRQHLRRDTDRRPRHQDRCAEQRDSRVGPRP